MKIKVWCDSGANAFSCREVIIETKEFGISDEQWKAMPEDEKLNFVEDIAFERFDWGFKEIE